MSNRRIEKRVSETDNKLEETTIKIRPNGPIIISGDFTIRDEKGKPLKKMQMMSLCRCGYTKSPPFCDGTHFKKQFSDE